MSGSGCPEYLTDRGRTDEYATSRARRRARRRIEMRIIVDTYSTEEQAMGWHAYLGNTMDFRFEARCVIERAESPLNVGETVRVIEMSPTEPTLSQMFVTVEWMDRTLGVPLEQLEPVDVSV